MWESKTWVKTIISWDCLLLKASVCCDVGGLQSLLPVIKLLRWETVSFADSAVLIHRAKVMLQSALLCRSLLLSSAGTRGPGGALPRNLTRFRQLLLGTGACSRGNLCYALPSTVSLLKLRHETQAWKMWNFKQKCPCM